MGQWIVGVISFQKIFGLCGLRGHKVEIRWDVTIVDNGRTECEDRAILKQNSQPAEERKVKELKFGKEKESKDRRQKTENQLRTER